MAEFFDWDRAEQGASASGDRSLASIAAVNLDLAPLQEGNHDFELALANIDGGDDFSYWALEHFQTSNPFPEPVSSDAAGPTLGEVEQKPCDACEAGDFDCRTAKEGGSKTCCTTCRAWNVDCSSPGGHGSRSSSSPDVANLAASVDSGNDVGTNAPAAPKIGARFSRESVRILKAFFSTHSPPYPNDEERENLQRQTGLSKTQIANWLANARRRSKQNRHHPTRSTSPSVRTWAARAVEITQRRRLAAHDAESLSPLQRWQNSPPENEPASVTAIASAILRSDPSHHYESGLHSPFNITDDDVAPSNRASSASSFGTSPSSVSFPSAFSQASRSSIGSLQQRGRRRRRRRANPRERSLNVGLHAPPKQFMCTFCTETFRTKHDWQRHEKSLHLSLEQWICCPNGPRALHPDNNQVCCVLCGVADPDGAHIESHNYTSCQERSLDERSFYRKDHLRQHLKLVHDTKYAAWAMDSWKVPTPDIRSRCGFCGVLLDSWPARVDHLAEHFKTGSDMLDWKGGWGLEPSVFCMVENAIPPYMIHDERTTPLPFQASQANSESPRNAYELIKLELAYWLQHRIDTAEDVVSDDELILEACRIIYASEALSENEHPPPSWLRALLLSSDDISRRARLGPLRSQAESCLRHLKVNGKDNIFEDCPLERQLVDFVQAQTMLGLTVSNDELRGEACEIIARMEESSVVPSEHIANLYLRLVHSSTSWLSSFRQRVGLSSTDDTHVTPPTLPGECSVLPTASSQRYLQPDPELAAFARQNHPTTSGLYSTDEEFPRHASCVLHHCQDGDFKQTTANTSTRLSAFKERHFAQETRTNNTTDLSQTRATLSAGVVAVSNKVMAPPLFAKQSQFFLNASCYRRLAWELGRFVVAAQSPNNPNRHVPSDEELKHQARCILYDDDDAFNRTAADNAEWLVRFKRSVGLLPATDDGDDSLPDITWKGGLRRAARPWRDGPPPLSSSLQNPPSALRPAPALQAVPIDSGSSRSAGLTLDSQGALGMLPNPSPPLPPGNTPGTVFASRDFEAALVQFAVSEMASSGRLPPDAALRARAKELSGFEVWQTAAAAPTPIDDPLLLARFKALVVQKVGGVLGDDHPGGRASSAAVVPLPLLLDHAPPERGLDAIDPGLLPASGEGGAMAAAGAKTLPTVHMAISESRLDEMIREALQR